MICRKNSNEQIIREGYYSFEFLHATYKVFLGKQYKFDNNKKTTFQMY